MKELQILAFFYYPFNCNKKILAFFQAFGRTHFFCTTDLIEACFYKNIIIPISANDIFLHFHVNRNFILKLRTMKFCSTCYLLFSPFVQIFWTPIVYILPSMWQIKFQRCMLQCSSCSDRVRTVKTQGLVSCSNTQAWDRHPRYISLPEGILQICNHRLMTKSRGSAFGIATSYNLYD